MINIPTIHVNVCNKSVKKASADNGGHFKASKTVLLHKKKKMFINFNGIINLSVL